MRVNLRTLGRTSLQLVSAGALALAVSACHRHNDHDRDVEPEPNTGGGNRPEVTATTPTSGAGEVAPTIVPTATFSMDMNPATLTAASFLLSAGEIGVPGSVSYDAATDTASFTPDGVLDPATTYTAKVTTAAANAAGAALAADYDWTFTTAGDAGWTAPERVDTTVPVTVRVARRGDKTAVVWYGYEFDPASGDRRNYRLRARIHTADGGWGPVTTIDHPGSPANTDRALEVTIDETGSVIVVWERSMPNTVWSNRYVPGTGWGTAQQISATGANALDMAFATDSAGTPHVVWYQNFNVYFTRYVDGGWLEPVSIEDDGGSSEYPSIAVNDAGNILVAWKRWDGTNSTVWSTYYSPDSGWSEPGAVADTPAGAEVASNMYVGPKVALDADGNGYVLWIDSAVRDGIGNLRANRYEPGTGWDEYAVVDQITERGQEVVDPQLAVDGAGRVTMMWTYYPGGDEATYGLWSRRFLPDGTLTEPQQATPFVRNSPVLKVTPAGETVVAYGDHAGTPSQDRPLVRRYSLTSGWGEGQQLDDYTGGNIDEFHFDMDADGNRVMAWRQGEQGVWVTRSR